MITPNQLTDHLCRVQSPQIENYIDSQLRTGRLRVEHLRCGWAQSDIDYTLNRYREAGWYITVVPGAWVFSALTKEQK